MQINIAFTLPCLIVGSVIAGAVAFWKNFIKMGSVKGGVDKKGQKLAAFGLIPRKIGKNFRPLGKCRKKGGS